MKRALCIGINDYPGAPLSGCINDATDWGAALQTRGYDVAYLIDNKASLVGITDALMDLVNTSKYGDRIVVTYSGHGTYRADTSGDEEDKQDEAICPWDYAQIGMLYDDEIAAILGRRAYGVRLMLASDSCFSGTVSRFAGVSAAGGPGRPRFLPPNAMPAREPTFRQSAIRSALRPFLLMGGASDSEYAWDAWFGNRPNGAFSRTALDTLANNPKTYQQWHTMIRAALPSDAYPQSPTLVGSYYRRHLTPLA